MTALSVILTTYNKPENLLRVFAGLRQQTVSDFELLVCDDGSGPETREVVEAFAREAAFPVQHVWQEDAGFRAARSRNNGARRAVGETLVFLDGDCVPLPDYLEAHRQAQRPRTFQAGERYMLEEDEAARLSVAAIDSGEAFRQVPPRELRRVRSTRRKDVFYRLTGIKPDRPRLMTSNCSLARAEFERVNGLDERYEGWGQEDEDLRRRLVRRQVQPSSVIGDANCLHIWHRVDKTFLGSRRASPNWAYYVRGFQLSRCRHGLRERSLAELSCLVRAGDPALREAARAGLGLGGPPNQGEPLEVELLLDSGTGPPPEAGGEAEVTVLLSAIPPSPARAAGAELVLAPGAETAGGELPGESHPEVPAPLARVGVKALRPLSRSALDAEAFAEAAACLDRLL